MDAPKTFLDRRRDRLASDDLSRWLVLGFLVSALMIGVGGFQALFVSASNDVAWWTMFGAGVVALLATLIFPAVWIFPEAALRRVGGIVGHGLFVVVLTLVYYLLFWPVGAWMRQRNGPHPIYSWSGEVPAAMEGWRPVTVVAGARPAQRSGLLALMAFFVRRGHLVLLPALAILALLGLVLFFVQTSAFAPFIYTLF